GSRAKVRSPEEMADAWADVLTSVLAGPPAGNGRLPRLRFPPNGRLERWGLSPGWAETVRQILGRRHLHENPGGEGPHWSGLGSAHAFQEIADFALSEEARHRHELLAPVEA